MSNDWSDDELEAAVEAYLFMLGEEQAGRTYSKAEIRRKTIATSLQRRSPPSFEFRMANISSVLNSLGAATIDGYKPRPNVGEATTRRLLGLLKKHGVVEASQSDPVFDQDELDKQTARFQKRFRSGLPKTPPTGVTKPARSVSQTVHYARDPVVRAWVLERANGVCEACQSVAPFANRKGEPFLEVHHLRPLSEGGPDTVANTVAVCPNCHRRLHYGSDNGAYTDTIRTRLS